MHGHHFMSTPTKYFFLVLSLLLCNAQSRAQETLAAPAAKFGTIDNAVDELTNLLMSVAGHVTVSFKDSDTTVVGDEKAIRVSSDVAGRLILIDIDSAGNVVQLYPNRYTHLDQWKIGSGDTLVIPDTSEYRIRAAEPTGKNKILAIVSPTSFDAKSLVTSPDRITNELSVESDPFNYFKTLIELIKQSLGTNSKGLVIEPASHGSTGWAFTYKEYFVAATRESGNEYFVDEEHPTSQIFLEPIDKSLNLNRAPLRDIYEKGMNLTKLSEGFRRRMYLDAANYCTIAYGHLIKKAPCDGLPEEFAKGVTETKGGEMLKADMNRAKAAVLTYTKGDLTDGQYAALADFTFNVGTRNFKNSTLLKQVNQRQFNLAREEFRKWVKAGGKVFRGLQIRRERELALFFEGESIPMAKSLGTSEMIDIREGEAIE